MAIERSDSQQTTCNAYAEIDGEKRQVACATSTIRPGKSFLFCVDLPLGNDALGENSVDVMQMFRDYMEEELAKAENLGIPI